MTAAVLACSALLADLPDPARLPEAPHAPTQSILITDRHGRPLYEVIDPSGSKSVPLAHSEIPPACRQATIATEDSRFYSHPGVDPLAIARALWQNLRSRLSPGKSGYQIVGASTLTQQLARNLYLPEEERTERSLRRKLREAWLAWRLERVHSKDELLALYLNTTYYGHYAVGIEAAAQSYFGIHAQELDLAQCALLAGLPQYPAGYNPLENPQAARSRQAVVLDLMARNGYITRSQAEDARKERLVFASTPFPIEAPHFVMWVQSQLEAMTRAGDDLALTGGTPAVPDDAVLSPARLRGGLRVTTTLDRDWQQRAEEIVARRLAQLRPCRGDGAAPSCDPLADPARRVENAALVALDPQDGAVLAMVGSPDYFDPAISGAVNAALSLRQPGSAIKPITYAAALDPERARQAGRKPWTAATIIADLRTAFPTFEGRPYVPQNYDLQYHGPVTLRAALANSYNIPAVKALQYIGVDELIDQAARMGIPWVTGYGGPNPDYAIAVAGSPRWLPEDSAGEVQPSGPQYGLALALGGGEVRLLDLVAAYSVFAKGGQQVTPHAISRIETLDGEVLYGAGAAGRSTRQVLDPRVAFLITDILSDENARVPAFGTGNLLEIGRPAAAKTGTTTDWRDNWTVGYTPELVTGVWVGNADNSAMRDVSGISGAAPIWHDFMRTVLRDAASQQFVRPDGLERVEICADSGLLPGGLTPGQLTAQSSEVARLAGTAQSVVSCPMRRFEWFIQGTAPAEVDTSHRQIAVDVRTGEPAAVKAPLEYIQPMVFWLLPSEYRSWAREHGVPQPPDSLAMSAPVSPAAGGASAPAVPLARPGHAPFPVGGETARAGGTGDSSASSLQDVAAPSDREPRAEGEALAAAPSLSEMWNIEDKMTSSPLAIVLTSPDPNAVYRLDPSLPAEAQQLPVTALLGTEPLAQSASVTLLLDGLPFAAVGAPDYTAWWPLSRGRHTFQAVVVLRSPSARPGPLGAAGAGARAGGSNGPRVESQAVTVFVE